MHALLQRTGYVFMSEDTTPEVHAAVPSEKGLASAAVFSVSLHGEPYGHVCFASSTLRNRWDLGHMSLLRNTADLVSALLGQQEAENQMLRNQNTYKAVLNNIASYVFVADPVTDEIIFANEAFKNTLALVALPIVFLCWK